MYWSYKCIPELEGLSSKDKKRVFVAASKKTNSSSKAAWLTIVVFAPMYCAIIVLLWAPDFWLKQSLLFTIAILGCGIGMSFVAAHIVVLNLVTLSEIRKISSAPKTLKSFSHDR